MHDNNHTINNQTRLNREAVLAIVCPQVGAVSETFIRKHIEHIAPDRTVLLTGNVLDDSWFHGNVKIIPIKSGFASFTPDVETAVVDFFRENRVTHILCEFGCIGGAVVELNHRILHLPMYVHFHGQDASEYLKKPEIVAYYRWMSNHVDGIITVSKPMAARLIEISIPEHKIKLIHSGVDCITGEKANPELSPCRFISVSRLVGKKGIHFVLNAFEKAKKAIPGLTLDLIGDGPLRADIEQFIADHNLLDSVKLHGNQPHGFVLEMLRKSSVLVQHSIVDPETGNREGLPISILEAASLGLPIISTFHEGIPEAVAHEVTGFLVKEGDWERMADYMIELAGDGKVRKKMGTAGRKNILNDGFTVSAMVAKIREFMGLNSSCAVKSAQSGKGTRILFVNHNLYPFENSGTPISTLNHALGMYDNGLEVAVLIPAPELRDGYKKQINDKFILYKLPRLDKHSTFLGEIDESFLEKYMKSVEQIIDDFAPDIVQINDYVYMPEAIVSLFHQKGAWVVRNVCNLEEICHMDYPVISDGLDGKLCSGPETPRQCAECYLRHKVAKDRKDIETGLLDELTSKIQRRIDAVQKNYDEAVDGVIFTENSFIDYFTRFIALDQKKTVTIPRGFQFRSKRKSTAKQISSNEIRFAFIGNLMFSKGPDIVLKAFAEIAALDNFTLEIYGAIVEDGYRRWIEQLEAKYPDKIKYHGKYQKEDIEKIAAAIDVALVTSYFDTYNRVVRELMYRGVPLIVTDFFGSSIVQDQVNSLKIETGNQRALAEAMRSLISDPAQINELSKGVIDTDIPSLTDEISAMIRFYNTLLDSEGSVVGNQTRTQQDSTIRLIAFYLPQYHPIPENDRWWGKDFTEWTNVAKATPLFSGHSQPHVPEELGYYDLRSPKTRRVQADLAREHGISGFCYYHYWFNGKRLLEKPFNEVLKTGEPDFPFCLCWANENWTRQWDGLADEILQEQQYGGEEDARKHFDWLVKAFRDQRYIKVDDKPLFLIYRPGDIPDVDRLLSIWREMAESAGLAGLYIVGMRTCFDGAQHSWNESGFDNELIFQPSFNDIHNFIKQNDVIELDYLNPLAKKQSAIIDYDNAWQIMAKVNARYPESLACVIPSWDNTARRKERAMVFRNSTPESYRKWLELELARCARRNSNDRMVFINAWNEWGEGNHLEPDSKHHRKYLEATRQALATSQKQFQNTRNSDWERLIDFSENLIARHDFDRAKAILNGILDVAVANVDALNNLAVIAVHQNDITAASNYLNKILQLDPSNEIALANSELLERQLIATKRTAAVPDHSSQSNSELPVSEQPSVAVDWTRLFDYKKLVTEEINEYCDIEVTAELTEGGIHEIDAWAYWFRYLSEKVWQTTLEAEIAAFCEPLKNPRILSLGCGYGGHELALARKLTKPYQIIAVDLNAKLFEKAIRVVEENDFNVVFSPIDLNFIQIDAYSFDIIFAHASLHHLLNFENLFYQIYRGLRNEGHFIVQDIIGKTQVLFWKENVECARDLVSKMPAKYKAGCNDIDQIIPPYRDPGDQIGMEGIRQAEIEAQIGQFFKPEKLFKYGSIARLICTNPVIGKSFDLSNQHDRKYLESIFEQDLAQIAWKKLKPTELFAVFEKRATVDVAAIFEQARKELAAASSGAGYRKIEKNSNLVSPFIDAPEDLEIPASVSIIIPVKNRLAALHNCLKSILRLTAYPDYEIIVVESGSTDGTKEYLAALNNAKIRGISLPHNCDLGRCRQAGIEKASGDYFLFLDPIFTVSRKWLMNLMKLAGSKENCAAVSPKIITPARTIFEAGFSELKNGVLYGHGNGSVLFSPQFGYVAETKSCSAHCLLVSKEAFNSAGGFDQNIPDFRLALLDLGLRLRQKSYALYYQPFSTIIVQHLQESVSLAENRLTPAPELIEHRRPKAAIKLNRTNGVQKKDRKKILVLGVYFSRKLSNIHDIVKIISGTMNFDVTQKWISLGTAPIPRDLKSVTVRDISAKIPKFQLLNELLENEDMNQYQYVLIVDDDIILPVHFIDRFITLQSRLDFAIAQPARTRNSYIDHPIVERHEGADARQTKFVEIGPVVSFHHSIFESVFPFDLVSPMGWGYENVWSYRIYQKGLKMGTIDCVAVDHSLRRPVENYNWSEANSQKAALLKKHRHLPLEECFKVLDVINFKGIR